jgi:hypothetical protein
MATPMTPAQWLANLRAEGVTVRERAGWTTHERDDETGRTFGPVHGVVIHHTAGRDSLALCWSGTSDLPGPLCHTHLSKTGVATMLSAGRANHAGSFAQNAHAAVLAEAAVHPRPDSAEPVDANDQYYGIEIENLGNGTDPYPAVQFDAAVRWAAAICRAHGWTENSVIGHKEGTRRKIDPSFDMNVFRAAVAARLAHDAGWNPNDQEDDVALTDADINKIAAAVAKQMSTAVWASDTVPAARPPVNNDDYFKADGKTPNNVTWTPGYTLQTTVEGVRKAQATLGQVAAAVAALPAVQLTDEDIATLASAVASNPALAEQIADKVAIKLAERLAE